MTERPILFSGPMVKAILDGHKTQTRRVVKNKIALEWLEPGMFSPEFVALPENHLCPYGFQGDRLWVRETWADVNTPDGPAICYRADSSYQAWDQFSKVFGPDYGAGPSMDYDAYPGEYCMWWEDLLNRDIHKEEGYKWKSPYHMPRWASRINLEITGVRVEWLQGISDADAQLEGLSCDACGYFVPGNANTGAPTAKECFIQLWDTINGKTYPWESNPWVWVVEFKRAT